VASVLIAGCGSSSSGSSDPVTTELSYFPAGSPLVLSVATDPKSTAIKNAQGLLNKFPLATLGESALMSKIQQLGIDYQSDIRPLFGNPIMLGATNSQLSSASASSSFLFVWVTKDGNKLKSLLSKLGGGHSTGSHDGATLYQAGTTTVAVDGATALLGPSTASVNAALDRHAHDGGITSGQYSGAFSNLPQGALMQVYGNLGGLLSQASAAKARAVPWVRALKAYAVTVDASPSGLTLKYRLDTSGSSLTSAQLPLSSGGAPSLAGNMPITVGVQDPAHIVSFAESIEQATSPSGWAKFQARQANARKKTGVDLNSILGLLTGGLIVASDTHTTVARAQVSDGATAARDLAKLASDPTAFFATATKVRKLGGGFYALRQQRTTITIGVVGNQLLVGHASPAQLKAFASAPTTPAPGAQGSVAFRVGLTQLLQLALKQAPPAIARSFLSSLGDLSGWLASTSSGTSGTATLNLH
jgi:hypothetical protein